MNRLSLKEACLLDVSGELSPAAREALAEYISQNPAACVQYEELREQFALLGHWAIPEPSAVERREIPARIKGMVRAELQRLRNRRALRRWKFIGCAAGGLASLAACLLIWASVRGDLQVQRFKDHDQVAQINRLIDLASANSFGPAASEPGLDPLDPAGREVRRLAHVFEGWATVPQDPEDWPGGGGAGGGGGGSNDPSSPPGTY